MGMSLTKYPSSLESLLRRALKGGPFPRFNPIVDLCNAMSLKYLVPIGGHAINGIDGDIRLTFADGTETEADAILMGTGFRHNLPWLDQDIARTIDLGAPTLGLFAQTLHPDLPGLAFLGQFDLIGPYFPVLELQARFVAGALSGQIALPAVLGLPAWPVVPAAPDSACAGNTGNANSSATL